MQKQSGYITNSLGKSFGSFFGRDKSKAKAVVDKVVSDVASKMNGSNKGGMLKKSLPKLRQAQDYADKAGFRTTATRAMVAGGALGGLYLLMKHNQEQDMKDSIDRDQQVNFAEQSMYGQQNPYSSKYAAAKYAADINAEVQDRFLKMAAVVKSAASVSKAPAGSKFLGDLLLGLGTGAAIYGAGHLVTRKPVDLDKGQVYYDAPDYVQV